MFQPCRFLMLGLTAVFLLAACGGAGETAVSAVLVTSTMAQATDTASATPQPTFTATSTPTQEPSATASPTAASTATSTATAFATPLPEPSATPKSSPTPRPSATPKPDTPPEPTSTWDRYQTRTLSKIQELTDPFLAESVAKYPAMYLEFSEEYQYPSRVRVIYSGEFREISPERKFALEQWFQVFVPDIADQLIPLFQHEVLVREGYDEYWMPVQEPLIPYMENELAAEGKATMFVVWMGAIIPGPEEVERIYLINEFRQ